MTIPPSRAPPARRAAPPRGGVARRRGASRCSCHAATRARAAAPSSRRNALERLPREGVRAIGGGARRAARNRRPRAAAPPVRRRAADVAITRLRRCARNDGFAAVRRQPTSRDAARRSVRPVRRARRRERCDPASQTTLRSSAVAAGRGVRRLSGVRRFADPAPSKRPPSEQDSASSARRTRVAAAHGRRRARSRSAAAHTTELRSCDVRAGWPSPAGSRSISADANVSTAPCWRRCPPPIRSSPRASVDAARRRAVRRACLDGDVLLAGRVASSGGGRSHSDVGLDRWRAHEARAPRLRIANANPPPPSCPLSTARPGAARAHLTQRATNRAEARAIPRSKAGAEGWLAAWRSAAQRAHGQPRHARRAAIRIALAAAASPRRPSLWAARRATQAARRTACVVLFSVAGSPLAPARGRAATGTTAAACSAFYGARRAAPSKRSAVRRIGSRADGGRSGCGPHLSSMAVRRRRDRSRRSRIGVARRPERGRTCGGAPHVSTRSRCPRASWRPPSTRRRASHTTRGARSLRSSATTTVDRTSALGALFDASALGDRPRATRLSRDCRARAI